MKKCVLSVLVGALGLASIAPGEDTSATVSGKHLFILSGQSNMARFDPDISFTPAVEETFGKQNVVVVKDALGGKPIRLWVKGWKSPEGKEPESTGNLYDQLMEKVKAALEGQSFQTVTFLWMQGERDAREELAEVYKESLEKLVAQLEKDLERKDINVVIGRLSDFDMENKKYPHWTRIRDIQVEFAKDRERTEWIDTDDLNGEEDALHYTKEGYKTFGERMAKAAAYLIQSAEDGAPE